MSEVERDTHFYVRDNDLWARSAYVPNKGDVLVVRADLSDALLREAADVLGWYDEQSRLARLIHSEGDAGRQAIAADGGGRASATLAKLRAHLEGEKE